MMFPPLSVLVSFAIVVGLLTITPGLDTTLVLRTAAMRGRQRASGVIAGIQAGTFVWATLASVGVSGILFASQTLYTVLRLAGAAYLLYLGARMIVAVLRHQKEQPTLSTIVAGGLFAGWRQGFITNLLNPKVGAFYVAVLPQFIPINAPHVTWGLSLALVHVGFGTVWLGSLMLAVRRMRLWLLRPCVRRAVDGIAGAAIVGFGVRLAAQDSFK